MPRTYTQNLGITLPANGEEDGNWGTLVNTNSNILDRAVNGVLSLTLNNLSSTLTTSDGILTNGQYKLLVLQTGTGLTGTHTITIEPNDAQKIYYVRNTTAQSVIFTQGSGGNYTLLAGDSAIIYSNGAGASAAVANIADHFAMSSPNITGGAITGITDLAVADGGTGASTASNARTNLGLGTAAVLNAGTAANNAVQLDGTAKLPAVDGSQLTGIVSIPSGLISLWSGAQAAIPTGWLLCDGTNGTPNLRDRFVVGAGSTYAVNATGGAATVALVEANLPAHIHGVSITTGFVSNDHTHSGVTGAMNSNATHSHSGVADVGGSAQSGVQGAPYTAIAGSTAAADINHTHSFTTGGISANHTHLVSGNTGSIGSGTAHENLPPYFALCYIMKS